MAKLTSEQWLKAKAMWASGNFRLSDISEQFNVTINALHRRFKKEGIEKGQDKDLHQKAIQEVVAKAASHTEELVKVTLESKEMHLKGSIAISKKLLLLMREANESNKAISTIHGDIKALLDAQRVLDQGYRNVEKILGLDKKDDDKEDLPVLEVVTMTSEDVKELRDEQRLADLELNGELDDIDDAIEIEDDVVEDMS